MVTRSLDKRSLEIRRLRGNFDRYRDQEDKFRKLSRTDPTNRGDNLRKAAYYKQLKAEAATSLTLDYGEWL